MLRQRTPTVALEVAKTVLNSCEGAQLLEFALCVPLLLIFVVAILDFGGAYNIKQELNNAAREGARYAANQPGDVLDVETASSAQAVGNVVQNYLTNAGLKTCTFTAPSSPTVVYTYSGSPSGCSLVINRGYDASGGAGTLISTRVTLSYPYTWTLTRTFKLLVANSTLALPTTISSDATMPNIN
jgi:Flp pilus assembly protein TadG